MIESMLFDLTCTFRLSKPEGVEDIVRRFVERVNRTILIRGAPKGRELEAARIVDWKAKGSELSFHIRSGTYVRAHVAALRVRKALSDTLGRELRIGIRGISVDYYAVTLILDREVPEDVGPKLAALSKVLRAAVRGNEVHLLFEPLSFHELRANVPDRVIGIVQEIIAKLLRPPRVVSKRLPVIRQSPPKALPFGDDPARVAIELGWIKEFPGRGQWVYTTPYAKLFYVIRDILLSEVAHKLGFEPFLLPKLIPLEVMRSMGYLDSIPEGMYYVCPPPREPEAFKTFKETIRMTREIPLDDLKRTIKSPSYVLAPAQCEPFWQFFAKEVVDAEALPIKLYDHSGWTYRWEGGGVEGIVRLQEFHRIELAYLGLPEQVVETRDAVVDELVNVVDRIVDLEWRITIARPFYVAEEEGPEEDIPSAYDIEIYLPYRGPRDKSEWLEVAGCFVHRRKYVDSFKIKERKGREIWTGCAGLGLSRFVAAFLAEYGLDPGDWPRSIARRYGKVPRLPRLLLWPSGVHVEEKEKTEEDQG
ncbi:TPA: serine--tRNA ligase [Candidatus Bathyarchaeota archaeon]|nr:serine--tRNA ligase [Candidatus Bathyarchaeota archaeon]